MGPADHLRLWRVSDVSYLNDVPDDQGGLTMPTDRSEDARLCDDAPIGAMAPDDRYAPAGCVELDGVLYCVAHDGIIDELSCRQNREGDVVCDQWDEYDDVCRMVPLFIRVVEDDRG